MKKAEIAESECNAENAVKKAKVKLVGKVSGNPAEKDIAEQVAYNEAVTKEDNNLYKFC